MIKTKARETAGGAEDEVGGRYSVGNNGFRPSVEKQTKRQANKQPKAKRNNNNKKTRNRKKRVLAAVISALEIGALTFKVNMDPSESFMRRLSC